MTENDMESMRRMQPSWSESGAFDPELGETIISEEGKAGVGGFP